MRLDCALERPVREVLQAQIDAGAQVLAVTRRTNARDVFYRAAETILEHTLGAGLAGQPVIEGKLETFLAFVIDVGETDQVARHFRRRVVAAVFSLHADSRQLEA